jgi:hypothetical protein
MKRKISEEEIARTVAAQANDNSAWDKPVRVRRPRSESLAIPGELAARAAFLARLPRQPKTEQWLTQIILFYSGDF